MTPMLATICFVSAYLLCHVNAIDAHWIRFALNAYRKPDYNELHVNGYGTTSTSYSLTSNYVPVVAWSDQDVWLELFLLPKCVCKFKLSQMSTVIGVEIAQEGWREAHKWEEQTTAAVVGFHYSSTAILLCDVPFLPILSFWAEALEAQNECTYSLIFTRILTSTNIL